MRNFVPGCSMSTAATLDQSIVWVWGWGALPSGEVVAFDSWGQLEQGPVFCVEG